MTRKYPKGAKIIPFNIHLSKLEKVNKPLQSTTPRNQPTWLGRYNGKLRDSNKSYVEVMDNLESLCIKKSKLKTSKYGSYLWWFPRQKTAKKFDGMYMNHSIANYDDWAQEKNEIYSYKEQRTQRTHDNRNSMNNGN